MDSYKWAPSFMARCSSRWYAAANFAILNFSKKIALIGGTGYTGELKKVFFLP